MMDAEVLNAANASNPCAQYELADLVATVYIILDSEAIGLGSIFNTCSFRVACIVYPFPLAGPLHLVFFHEKFVWKGRS